MHYTIQRTEHLFEHPIITLFVWTSDHYNISIDSKIDHSRWYGTELSFYDYSPNLQQIWVVCQCNWRFYSSQFWQTDTLPKYDQHLLKVTMAPFDMRLTESSQTFFADSVSKMCLIIQFWPSDSVRNVWLRKELAGGWLRKKARLYNNTLGLG